MGDSGRIAVFWLTSLVLATVAASIAVWTRTTSSPSPAQSEDVEAAKRFYRTAQEAMSKGAFEEALTSSNEAMRLAPSRVPPYLLRARLFSQANRYQEAVRDGRIALKLAPNELSVMLQLLRIYPPYESYREMETVARRAVRQAPRSAEAHFYLGSALAGNPDPAQWDEAASELNRASDLAPWMAHPLIELGRLYIRQRKYNFAQSALESAWKTLNSPAGKKASSVLPAEWKEQKRNTVFWLLEVYKQRHDPRAKQMVKILEHLSREIREEEERQARANAMIRIQ